MIRERSLFTAGGGRANRGGKNFSVSKLRGGKVLVPAFRGGGGKILVHTHLRPPLKHLENTLKHFRCRYTANTIQCNTTTFINLPTVKGHFGMMCKTFTNIIHSNEFTC